MNKIDEPMRFQARQGNSRKVERVDPGVFQKRIPSRVIGHKRPVETDVMSHHDGIAGKFSELGEGVIRLRCAFHIAVMDAGEVNDIFRYGHSRIDERDEPVDNFAAI